MSLAKDYGLLVVLTAAFLVPAATVVPTFKKPVLDFLKLTGSALVIAAGGGAILVLAGGGVLLTEEVMRRFRKRGKDTLPKPPEGAGNEGPASPPLSNKDREQSVGPTEEDARKKTIESHVKDVRDKVRKRMAKKGHDYPEEVEMDEL